MEYYYTRKENVDLSNNELVIDDFEFRHLTKVLRKHSGDEVIITDGERNIYYCRINKTDKEKIYCDILRTDYNLYEPKIEVALYLAPLRNSDRFEFAIEKAVELGVSSIHPVITEFTVNKNFLSSSKTERIKKIIIGAMGQSQRCLMPEFHETITFHSMMEKTKDDKNKVVMYEFSNDASEIKLKNDSKGLSILIGPEGGLSSTEISELEKTHWQIRSLGERKLRAETAAIVSVFDIISKLN